MTVWGRGYCLEVFLQCLKELAVDLWREEGRKQKGGGEERKNEEEEGKKDGMKEEREG